MEKLLPRKNTIAGIAVAVVGLAIYFLSRSFPELPEGYPGPGLFPKIIGGMMALLGIATVFIKESAKDIVRQTESGRTKALLLAIALTAFIPFVADRLPLLAILPVFIFLMGLLFKIPIKWVLLISAVTTLLIYLIFSLMLGVAL